MNKEVVLLKIKSGSKVWGILTQRVVDGKKEYNIYLRNSNIMKNPCQFYPNLVWSVCMHSLDYFYLPKYRYDERRMDMKPVFSNVYIEDDMYIRTLKGASVVPKVVTFGEFLDTLIRSKACGKSLYTLLNKESIDIIDCYCSYHNFKTVDNDFLM